MGEEGTVGTRGKAGPRDQHVQTPGIQKSTAYLGRAFKPETWVEFPNDLSVFCGLPLMRF